MCDSLDNTIAVSVVKTHIIFVYQTGWGVQATGINWIPSLSFGLRMRLLGPKTGFLDFQYHMSS